MFTVVFLYSDVVV